MNTVQLFFLRRACVPCFLLPCLLSAQSVAPAEPAARTESPIVLSPFEVSETSDEGYAARETLSGTRFKSELKDVPSQVSIMTKEFLEDIGSVTIEDAFRYSLNVENTVEYTSATSGGGDFNAGVLNTRQANRIRGLASAGVTHDFFQSNIMQDSYNTERISYASGPNAILFGNGNPGGIVDTTFLRANMRRPRYQVSLRTDNYSSLRGSVDLNQPLIRDVLAVRFAAVKSQQEYWRQPAVRRDDRYFGTLTFKPFRNTTLRVYYEDSMLDQTPARNMRFGDQVTPWINAGRPAFNNGLNSPTVINASNSGIFARNTVNNRNVWILGYAASNSPYTIWGSAASANIALPATRYSVNTIGPGSQPNQTGVDQHIYSLPNDESILPFEANVNGNGTRNLIYGEIYGASFEQRLPGNVFFQVDYNREKTLNPVSDFLRGISSALRADANLYLPDRVTPNPNFGRYYVDAEPRVFVWKSDFEESRAMLSYELDLTKRQGWSRWFGRHRAAAMYQRSETMGVQQEHVQRIVPAGTPTETILDNFGGGMFNTFTVRAYLSDPTDSSTGKTFSLNVPFDPVRTTTYTMPDGSTYIAGYKNPYGASGAANMNNNLLEGKVLAVQSFFLKDRLVTSLGWRRDSVRQATRSMGRRTAAPQSAFESITWFGPSHDWLVYTKGSTSTQGAVLHIFPWLSTFYNQSNTWNPPTGLINPDDGTQVPGATGEGKDYGIMLRFLNGRISLRLNKYENTSGPSSDTGFRNAIIPVVQNIENTLLDRTEDGTITKVPPPKYYDSRQGTYTQSGLFSDLVSKGYELEVIANPTRDWRIALSAAKSNATASNIGGSWILFIEERSSVWAANSTLQGPTTSNTTIGSRYLGIIQVLNQMKQADGQSVESGREWRVNLVTRYGFSQGPLKGAFIGGGHRYRSPQVIGYRATQIGNEFPLPGAPTQVLVPSREFPIKGSLMTETDLFVGYGRKLGRRIDWRIQLNIRNLLDNRDPVGERANVSQGFISVYTMPDPRSFILTNTFTF